MMSGDYENLLQTFDKSFGSVVTMYRLWINNEHLEN